MASNPKFRIMAGFRILNILNVRNPLTLGVLFLWYVWFYNILKNLQSDLKMTQPQHKAATEPQQRLYKGTIILKVGL